MEDNNPYAVSFRSMRNKLDGENEAVQNEGRAIQYLQLYFMKKGTRLTEKVYSLPSADEIAAVCAPTDEGEFQEASYVSFPKHGELKIFKRNRSNKRWYGFSCTIAQRIKEFGHPDLLTTFISNPRKDEILHKLLDAIVKHHILGKVSCYSYRIEFQKRDLPHAHILIKFQQENKLNTTNKIDNIISAEIPSIEQDSELHNEVLNNIEHRECHEGSDCWENNECKKVFLKQFCEFTQLSDKGYPLYQRKDKSVEATEGKYQNNRWVVPYNRILLLKYNVGINVKHCASLKGIKYVFKYIFKPSDRSKYQVTSNSNKDEIPQKIKLRSSIELLRWTLYVRA
ncbi:MAG: putative ATP-dependent DNA helicase PIF1 [Streblomastix strix]|uniref:Putative ATP-dependent DNA helicase PIF1 n=1 Tax=Streblomastix strix TaxID=222440 RepID=A0A5J4V6E3_9EUKA|nr:MAG: putative ATP-dependent DNA helicase PIF1 [Streblomastix strix]